MTALDSTTYLRPINADTGAPTLAVYFTAALFDILRAHEYDLAKQTDELAADVRDELDRLGIGIRPTITHGRIRIMQEIEPDESGVNQTPMVFSTVIAYLTDAEPDDPRLSALAEDFSENGSMPTSSSKSPTASEAALQEEERTNAEAARRYTAKADSERAAAAEVCQGGCQSFRLRSDRGHEKPVRLSYRKAGGGCRKRPRLRPCSCHRSVSPLPGLKSRGQKGVAAVKRSVDPAARTPDRIAADVFLTRAKKLEDG